MDSPLKSYFYIFFGNFQNFLENNGWPILFAVICIISLQPQFNTYIKKQSLRHANRSERRAVLDKELLKIREKQQEEYMKALHEVRSNNRINKKSIKTEEEEEQAAQALAALIRKHKSSIPQNISKGTGGITRRKG
jgi:isocitrate/isopropylmalate dehydrogenase